MKYLWVYKKPGGTSQQPLANNTNKQNLKYGYKMLHFIYVILF